MLEPSTPVTVKVRYRPYPAVLLPKGGDVPLKAQSVVLRHRYLKNMHTVVSAASIATDSAAARPTVGIEVQVARSNGGELPSRDAVAHPAPQAPVAGTATASAADSAPLQESSPAELAQNPPALAGADLPAQPKSSSAETPNGASSEPRLTVKWSEYTIRDTPEKTGWFYSSSPTYLLEPPVVPRPVLGNLYVHTTPNQDRQIWLYTRANAWEQIKRHHPHPFSLNPRLLPLRAEPYGRQNTTR
ncbi:hypothetical protein C8T65DRAFT_745741 [Cerioporus squamosus]|nr:hypothetical protein C8T65DRAFT_745741 [Cerioporus squamosus]